MSLLSLNSKRKHGSNPQLITKEPPCKMSLVKTLPKILTKRGRVRHLAASILKTSPNNNTSSKLHKKPQKMTTRVTPLLLYPTRKESLAQVSSWTASTKREAVMCTTQSNIHRLHKFQLQMLLMKMKFRKNIEISYSRETLSSNQRRKFSTSIE